MKSNQNYIWLKVQLIASTSSLERSSRRRHQMGGMWPPLLLWRCGPDFELQLSFFFFSFLLFSFCQHWWEGCDNSCCSRCAGQTLRYSCLFSSLSSPPILKMYTWNSSRNSHVTTLAALEMRARVWNIVANHNLHMQDGKLVVSQKAKKANQKSTKVGGKSWKQNGIL